MQEPDEMEIATAVLSDIGYHSFVEEGDALLAYIQEQDYSREQLSGILEKYFPINIPEFTTESIPDQNWNLKWEENFEPVIIGEKCLVRAPFHKGLGNFPYEIIIRPQMSFGTAHHETTRLMIELMMDTGINNNLILDMGTGTGILAVLANKMGAKRVIAIDTDEWAYLNALSNIELNDAKNIFVIMGDSSALVDEKFDIILANINRNVLLEDIPLYSSRLEDNGVLLLSGFYRDDQHTIRAAAEKAGLFLKESRVLNNWNALRFIKE